MLDASFENNQRLYRPPCHFWLGGTALRHYLQPTYGLAGAAGAVSEDESDGAGGGP